MPFRLNRTTETHFSTAPNSAGVAPLILSRSFNERRQRSICFDVRIRRLTARIEVSRFQARDRTH